MNETEVNKSSKPMTDEEIGLVKELWDGHDFEHSEPDQCHHPEIGMACEVRWLISLLIQAEARAEMAEFWRSHRDCHQFTIRCEHEGHKQVLPDWRAEVRRKWRIE